MKGDCGKQMKVTYNGKSITVPIVDTCEACASDTSHIDLTEAAYLQLAPNGEAAGHINVSWQIL